MMRIFAVYFVFLSIVLTGCTSTTSEHLQVDGDGQELGEEAMKFKKNKNLYKEVSAILDKESHEAWKRIRDKE